MNTLESSKDKKPFYKSLTIQGQAISTAGLAWLFLDLLVKPAEMIIKEGHISYIELLPSSVLIVAGAIATLNGRLRKGDLFVDIPKRKKKATSSTTN